MESFTDRLHSNRGQIAVLLLLIIIVFAVVSYIFVYPQFGIKGLVILFVPVIFLIVVYKLVYGVYILLALLPLSGVMVFPVVGVHITLSDGVAAICILALLMRFILAPSARFFRIPLLLPFFVYIAVYFIIFLLHLPAILAKYPINLENLNAPGISTIKVMFWCVYSFLIAFTIANAIETEAEMKTAVKILIYTTVAVALYSLTGLGGRIFRIRELTWGLIEMGIGVYRLRGTFREPSYFAHYMTLIFPIMLVLFIMLRDIIGRFMTVICLLVVFTIDVMILSTAGLVGSIFILIALPSALIFYRAWGEVQHIRYIVLILVMIALSMAVWLFYEPDYMRIIRTALVGKIMIGVKTGYRASGRYLMWLMFQDYPFFGVGPGNLRCYDDIYLPLVKKVFWHKPSINNLYLDVLLEGGITLAIFFMYLMVSYFRTIHRAIRSAKSTFLKGILIALMVGSVAALIEFYAASNFYRIYIWIMFGLAMAAIKLVRYEKEKEAKKA